MRRDVAHDYGQSDVRHVAAGTWLPLRYAAGSFAEVLHDEPVLAARMPLRYSPDTLPGGQVEVLLSRSRPCPER